MSDRPKVSALVSAFKSERFLAGCLEDLERQTIADRLEIIVVNSNSPQNEDGIVRKYMRRFGNITYVRTPMTESIYAAWNRAILMSSGEYVTNANTDDRHRRDAFEVMATVLDANHQVGLVYAGYLITHEENETFERNTSDDKAFMPLDYDRAALLRGYCFPGPQPMWRRDVHRDFGLFEPGLESAGDLEFWLRISQAYPFMRVPEVLGLYLQYEGSAEYRDWGKSQQETAEVLAFYNQAAG